MASKVMFTAVPKPEHVPDELVVDFNIFGEPQLLEDLHGRVLDLARNAPPIFWSPYNGGAWLLASHEVVFKASRDPERFTSEFMSFDEVRALRAALGPDDPHLLMPTPINMDPPVHTAYRAPLQTAFSPKAMLALREDIRALCVSLIEAVKEEGGCEFMEAIAEPLPVRFFLRMFGLPEDKQKEYRALVVEHNNNREYDRAKTQRMLQKLAGVMHDTIMDRQENPRGDLISLLWSSTIEGQSTTLNDIEDYCVVLFLAGLDTVMNGMGLGIRHLAMNPDLQAKVRADLALVPDVTEEILRRYTFTIPPRMVARDMVFEGVTMKRGEVAYLFLPAADLDEAEFPEPQKFDLQRENKAHIAFGTGPHRCLGSHLARIELQVLYEEMLTRLPEFRIDPERPPVFHGGTVLGPEELWIRWD